MNKARNAARSARRPTGPRNSRKARWIAWAPVVHTHEIAALKRARTNTGALLSIERTTSAAADRPVAPGWSPFRRGRPRSVRPSPDRNVAIAFAETSPPSRPERRGAVAGDLDL